MGTYSLEMQHLMFRNLQISSELRKHIGLKYQCCVFIVTKSEVRKILKAALKFNSKVFPFNKSFYCVAFINEIL